jgi:endonuclease YncB( thermonuclease family)
MAAMTRRTARGIAPLIALFALLSAVSPSGGQSHAPRAGDEGVFYGPLVRVKDGDSLVVKVQGVAMDIRLAGIDAPELGQPYGRDAKQTLASLAAGKQLVIKPLDTDRYGRTVADVWNGEMQLNTEMVRRGGAWFYSEFARNAGLYDIEQEARNAKRGLWALPLSSRIEPWVWRERHRSRN